MKRYEVAQAWSENRKAGAGRTEGGQVRFHTDGSNLWSYGMLIGITGVSGVKFLLNVGDPNVKSSSTTKRHFNDARRACRATGKDFGIIAPLQHGWYASGWQRARFNNWLEFPPYFLTFVKNS